MRETQELRAAVWDASGGRTGVSGGVSGRGFKSRKGFGFRARQAKAKPGNTSVRGLLSDDRYTEAVLVFLAAARVGEVEE